MGIRHWEGRNAVAPPNGPEITVSQGGGLCILGEFLRLLNLMLPQKTFFCFWLGGG